MRHAHVCVYTILREFLREPFLPRSPDSQTVAPRRAGEDPSRMIRRVHVSTRALSDFNRSQRLGNCRKLTSGSQMCGGTRVWRSARIIRAKSDTRTLEPREPPHMYTRHCVCCMRARVVCVCVSVKNLFGLKNSIGETNERVIGFENICVQTSAVKLS